MIFVFLILLALPFAIWWVLGGRRTLPLVVVQILCGIALGPAVFGKFAPNFHAAIFSPDIIKGLNATALLAVMIFVFFAGVELNAHWLGDDDIHFSHRPAHQLGNGRLGYCWRCGFTAVGCGWRQIGRGSDSGTNPKLAKGRCAGDWLAFANQGPNFDHFFQRSVG